MIAKGSTSKAKVPRPKRETNITSRQDLIDLGRADMVAFSRWPLGYEGANVLWKCQVGWQELAQESYIAKLRAPIDTRHLALLAPSEHGKTYGLDIPFILWALARNRNLRVGVVGSKDDLATNIGHGIDRLFKRRGDKLAEFGLIPGTPWNAFEKFLQRDDDKLIHPSIMFLGPESEVQGVRFDIIFLTDFCTFKNQRTPEQRAKLLDWLDHTLFPRLEPWGFIMAEGHHVDPDDIYSELEEREDEWMVKKYRAILDEPSQSNNNKATVLAPEQWSYKQLARIRSRRPGIFQLIYQNVPVERIGIVSRAIFEKCFDRSRPLQLYATPAVRAAYSRIVMGIDPAFTIKRYSSHSACTIWGIHEDGVHKDLLGGWRIKVLPPVLRSKIIQTILAWNPDDVFIEANAAQVFFVQEVQARLGKKAACVKPVYSLANDPDTSVEQMMGEFVAAAEASLITLPYSGQDAQALVEQFVLEITNFPNARTKDVAMSVNIMLNGLTKAKLMQRKCIKFAGITGMRRHLRT